MNHVRIATGLLFAAILLAAPALARADIDLEAITCPVSGKPVKADASIDYKGAKLYFCCNNCPKAFARKKKALAAKANAQLAASGQAKQTACPISGKPCNPEATTQVAGSAICFCCKNCLAKVNKAKGAGQLRLVFGDKAFKKAFKVQ